MFPRKNVKQEENLDDSESVFDPPDEVGVVDVIEYDSDAPHPTDPSWHEFIMKQFTPNEIVENNGEVYPNCYGLRRIAELYLGTILESKPTSVIATSSHSTRTPSIIVQYELTYRDLNGDIKTVGDAAESNEENCDSIFLFYPVATACTRAEGRVLRKALKLRCLAAEELTRTKDVKQAAKDVKATEPVSGEAPRTISDKQMNLIQSRCAAMNIDVLKFVNVEAEKKYGNLDQVVNPRTGLTIQEASDLIKLLTGNYKVDSNNIPKEIML